MNSDDNKDSKPTSSDEISDVNPIEDSKEKDESKQEGHNEKRTSKYSEDQIVASSSHDEVPSKCRRMTTPPNQSGQTSTAEATDQGANVTGASTSNSRSTPTYEQLLLAILDLHGQIEARKERFRKGWEKKRKDDDCSDEDPENLV